MQARAEKETLPWEALEPAVRVLARHGQSQRAVRIMEGAQAHAHVSSATLSALFSALLRESQPDTALRLLKVGDSDAMVCPHHEHDMSRHIPVRRTWTSTGSTGQRGRGRRPATGRRERAREGAAWMWACSCWTACSVQGLRWTMTRCGVCWGVPACEHSSLCAPPLLFCCSTMRWRWRACGRGGASGQRSYSRNGTTVERGFQPPRLHARSTRYSPP